MKKRISLIIALLLMVSLLPATATAAGQNVEWTVTVRDFNADGVLFEGNINADSDLVQKTLGADKKPVYNLALWRERFGEGITQNDLYAFFNDVPGVNMKTTKTLTLRPSTEEEYSGYWEIDSSIGPNGEELDGYFPIDNELFGNPYTLDGETYDDGHNYHFSVEAHTKFKYVKGGTFWFCGDDDVWVFFNNQLVIDLGGVHGEMEAEIALDDIAAELGIKAGDIVDFDLFYMERHTVGSNMKIRTNFDFLNLQASAVYIAELQEALAMGLIPDMLIGADLTQPINREEFAALSVKTFEAMSGVKAVAAKSNPFTDCKEPEVLKAVNVGITNGVTETKFDPEALLTRQQAATMLTRVYKKVNLSGWTLATDGNYKEQFNALFTRPATFADDAQISPVHKDSVYFMAANGIIKGYPSDNTFRPRATTSAQEAVGYGRATRQQAIVIATRMVKALG